MIESRQDPHANIEHLFAWASISYDKIEGEIQLGGPPSYGGAALFWLARHNGLHYLQAINVNVSDYGMLPNFVRANSIFNDVPNTVMFLIEQCRNHRNVQLLSKGFKIGSVEFLALRSRFEANVVVLSPIICEFEAEFLSLIGHTGCKAVFLDLFNNDDGYLSDNEFDLLDVACCDLARHKQVFLKLSIPEYLAVLKHIPALTKISGVHVLVTKGSKGAELYIGSTILRVPACETSLISSIGAGDVFMYFFAGLFALGHPLDKCLIEANRMAARSVSASGVEELLHAFSS